MNPTVNIPLSIDEARHIAFYFDPCDDDTLVPAIYICLSHL